MTIDTWLAFVITASVILALDKHPGRTGFFDLFDRTANVELAIVPGVVIRSVFWGNTGL